jgi:hypothetical protein
MTNEGANITFYDFVGVTPSASQDEIKRAYRKKSKTLHPDKVKAQLNARTNKSKNKSKPGVTVTKPPTQSEIKAAIKAAGERQTRLGVIANILTGPERARYDHFMSNGFPTWKGTGYYYSRYRPGLGTVLIGVFLAGAGGFHYIALYMGWKRQREFIERYIKFARHAAWGDNLGIAGVDAGVTAQAPTPEPAADDEQGPMMPTNRKQRREQERMAKKESAKEGKRSGRPRGVKNASGSATPVPQTQPSNGSGPTGAKKRVVAENGKILVVDSLGDVYLEQEDEDGNVQEFLLDVSLLCKNLFVIEGNANNYIHSRMRCLSPLSATPLWSDCLSGPSAVFWERKTPMRILSRSKMWLRNCLTMTLIFLNAPQAVPTRTMISNSSTPPRRVSKIWPRSAEASLKQAARPRRGATRSGSCSAAFGAW